MPMKKAEVESLSPKVRQEFDLTHSTYADLVAFFVEHPEDAYSSLEIVDIADANSETYSSLQSERGRGTGISDTYFETLCRLSIIESISDGRYYRLSDEETAQNILDVTNWVEDNEAISRIQRRRGLKEALADDD